MKGKIIAGIILFFILVIPIPTGIQKDGGTRTYSALTYKIVKWNRLNEEDGIYSKTRVYFLVDAYRSMGDLWEREAPYLKHRFVGEIKDISGDGMTVEPMEWEEEYASYPLIHFAQESIKEGEFEIGNLVQVVYQGDIAETNPASVKVVSCEIAKDLRFLQYCDQWIPDTAEEREGIQSSDLVITQIYSNCFFARTVVPTPFEYKINGELPEKWCVGDQVYVSFFNIRHDSEANRIEADIHKVEESDFELQEGVAYKPVIYLYPEKETKVSVRLQLNGELTCTYPSYGDGWSVVAQPDGTLKDTKGKLYNYLYWEGKTYANYDFSTGFCVKGEETAEFLEVALEKLGLNRKEANEFIVYWLPMMQENPYNIISFQTDAYTESAKLDVKPKPDTTIRVYMAWKASDKKIEMKEQKLEAPNRIGFTVVEWGGTEVIDR